MSIDTEDEEEFPELKKISLADIQSSTSHNEKRWRLSLLKKQFIILQLDALFRRFIERISHGYFSQFLSLQIVLITGHFIILFTYADEKQKVIPDLVLYGIISLFSVFLLYITDTFVKNRPKLLNYLAGTAFIVTFFMNFFIPFYYKTENPAENLRPAYTTYLIISNYIFLNIHNDLIAIVLGLFVSIFHLSTLILVTYDEKAQLYERIGSDSTFLLGINCLGIYFRYMNEIVIRRSFLDKRSCIWSTHQLAFEYQQAQQLLSSILPEHIIVKVRGSLLDNIREKENKQKHLCYFRRKRSHNTKNQETETNMFLIKPFDDVYVEDYPNVTILFADIVNYTAMTTQLNVTDLLEILNELFGRFDEASDRLQVLRIKFLGDCYYCVSGLPPNPPPNPAEACVDLGLRMISIIADIRNRNKGLDINMRIGIHSGNISCGIIGALKWQYDIWSADVDLANKMETEGTAGMVHITQETKRLLRKNYNVKPKLVNGNKTYLITPGPEKLVSFSEEDEDKSEAVKVEDERRPSLYMKRSSTVPNDLKNINIGRSNSLLPENDEVRVSIENEKKGVVEGKRHTFPTSNERRRSSGIFQKRSLNSRVRYSTDRRLTPHDVKRRTAFMNNNIKRHNERLDAINKELADDIENMLISKFEQWFKAHDMYRILLIFKDLKNEVDFIKMPDPLFRYYLVTKILVLGLVFILENLTLSKWEWPEWPFYVSFGVTLLIFIPLSWTYFIWTKYFAINENVPPKNIVIRFLYSGSKLIIRCAFIRFLIYTFLYFLFCLCVLFEWIECYPSDFKYENHTKKRMFSSLLSESNDTAEHCIIPWHMTETFALAIIVSFLFLRMYMWIKLFYAAALAITYTVCITNFSGRFYDETQAFNVGLRPEISHVMSIFFLTIILHLVDRQTEHMNRTDHLWYKKLAIQEKKATTLQTINKILLQNILPVHVASEYLNVDRKVSNELYTENYSDVAVMFASLVNISFDDLGPGFLKIMNLIITEFDMLLVEHDYGRPIEKIKIAKWTYMAACGVVPGKGDSDNYQKDHKENVVISLLKFAASLMKKLQELNKRETGQNMQLRIGIANGPVAAGVVGSKKPLYDIWGDPVNMASRMDTTGIAGRIQVLESTAEIIQKFGYVCEYRGKTVVKGRPHPVETYFVSIDDNYSLIPKDDEEK